VAQYLEERCSSINVDQLLGYFVDDRLAATMTIIPFHTYINGKALKMGGIGGIATWPEYRRKGMVGKLLLKALKIMMDDGQSISFLAPFSYSFYRKYGWETCFENKQYTIHVSLLPKFQASNGHVVRVDRDSVLINSIYELHAINYNGTLQRTEAWWQEIYKKNQGHTAVYYNEAGSARGYIFYNVKHRVMNIHEMVFLDEEARRSLWNFISNHDSMLDNVMLSAPIDDRLNFLLENPRIKQEVFSSCMARIVDVEAFLKQFPFREDGHGESFVLHIEDRQAAWNNDSFVLEVAAGGVCKSKIFRQEVAVEDQGLSCDIPTLTTMMLGYQLPTFLHDIGRLKGKGEEAKRWERCLPKRNTYIMDSF
jgi:predicted acetyltransferase